ncbi:hypothetical protein DRW03_14030 [Corallococcus sp. H22C18031201]|uniref:hypothetical protein n=1 Tax=Citreicoccus inhibens TaxID=2849499 RepID=UPI000E725F6E|nr:hypothetical protein [Citreicoccus inhibens]MBU8895538.1 hypothetical protein [Citreicoccus inhibens]RJS22436.1 hypothetical protein DRW03_14030 [Corallococcus sp. H22C18031201]
MTSALRALALAALLLAGAAHAGEEVAAPETDAVAAPAVEPVDAPPAPGGYRDVSESMLVLMDEGVHASVQSGALMARFGYTPLQVSLENVSPVARSLQLSFESSEAGGRVATMALKLAPRQRMVTHLLIPAGIQSGSALLEGEGLGIGRQGVYVDNPGTSLGVLVLGTQKEFELVTALARAESGQSPLMEVRFMDPALAPRQLVAYAGYGTVMVATSPDKVSGELWAALESYAATGGNLVIAQAPRDLSARLPLDTASEAEPLYGFGQIHVCSTTAKACVGDLEMGSHGVDGPVVPVGLSRGWAGNRHLLSNGESPLLASARSPVGHFLFLMVLFAVVVGPGSLLLSRRKGPVAVLIAVPSVALVTCVALVLWSVLVEGFSVHAARYSLTWLDRERSRAITVGLGAWYANLPPDSFELPDTSVLIAPEDGEGTVLDLDWTHGLVVRGGFLPARTYREWGELAVVPSRARLRVHREGSDLVVQNALGGPLLGGAVRMAGTLWTLPALADGAEGKATLRDESAQMDWGFPEAAANRFSRSLLLFTEPPVDGEFVARMRGMGTAPTATLEVALEDSGHVIRGQVDEGRP